MRFEIYYRVWKYSQKIYFHWHVGYDYGPVFVNVSICMSAITQKGPIASHNHATLDSLKGACR